MNFEKKRKQTFFVFCYLAACLGTEYSIVVPSLLFYLDDIDRDKPDFVYGLTLAAYYVTSIFGGLLISRYSDKKRNARRMLACLLIAEIVGNVVYSVPYSVYFPLLGRFVQGLGDVTMSVMTAEVSRMYPRQQLTERMASMVSVFSVTFVAAPAINLLFKAVDFRVGGFHIYFGNMPGIFMTFIFLIGLVAVLCWVTDSSELEGAAENSETETSGLITPREVTSIQIQASIALLISLGFFMSFSIVAYIDVAFPLIASRYYSLDSRFTSTVFLACGLEFMMALQGIKRLSRHVHDVYLIGVGLAVFACSSLVLVAVCVGKTKLGTAGICLLVTHVLLLALCWSVEQVFVRSLLAKLVVSEKRTFYEALRRSASSIGCILAGVVASAIFSQLLYLCAIIVCFIFVFMFLLYRKKEGLSLAELYN